MDDKDQVMDAFGGFIIEENVQAGLKKNLLRFPCDLVIQIIQQHMDIQNIKGLKKLTSQKYNL